MKIHSKYRAERYHQENKYSIRKFTVGTASILMGTTLLFGIGNEADAAENSESHSKEEVASVETKEEVAPVEVKKETPPAEVKEEAAPVEVKKETPSVEVKKEAAPVEVKEKASSVEVKKETPPVEEKKEAVSTEAKKDTTPVEMKSKVASIEAKSEPSQAMRNAIINSSALRTESEGKIDTRPKPIKSNIDGLKKAINWVNFGEDGTFKYDDGSLVKVGPNGIPLEVGMKYEKEIAPGYAVVLEITELKPFNSTNFYKERVEGTDAYDTYNPNATNTDAQGNESRTLVAIKQSQLWSSLAVNGMKSDGHVVIQTTKDSANVGIKFKVKAIVNGMEHPADVVVADGESQGSQEMNIFTTNGHSWEWVADVNGHPDVGDSKDHQWKVSNSKTLKKVKGWIGEKAKYWQNPDQGDGGIGTKIFGPIVSDVSSPTYSTPIVLSRQTTELGAYFVTNGQQGITIGFLITDSGDAPESYGSASHARAPQDLDGKEIQQPYLGSTPPDVDNGQTGRNIYWKKDDIENESGIPDEGEEQLVGIGNKYGVYDAKAKQYVLSILASNNGTKPAKVAGWIDFNNDGQFSEDERSEVVEVTNNQQRINLVFRPSRILTNENVSNVGARVRIAIEESDILLPIGTAASGEVEDFLIPVIHPPRGSVKETIGLQGMTQSGVVNFEAIGKTKNHLEMNRMSDKPAKLVDASNNEVDRITISGEGTYTITPDGTVTFEPVSQFVGRGTGVTVRRWDINGSDTNWVNPNGDYNTNKLLNTMDGVFIPTVTAVTPIGEDVTSKGEQGQPQAGAPTFKGGNASTPIDETVPATFEDGTTEKNIPGEGTYTVSPDGKVAFTPDPQFVGEGKGVEVKRVDKNGTPVLAKYTPTVTAVTPTGEDVTSTGEQGQPQEGTPVFKGGNASTPIDETVPATFEDGTTEKNVPGEGTYTVSPDGKVTFTPDPQFVGEGKGVEVKRVDKNGTPVLAKYTPTVTVGDVIDILAPTVNPVDDNDTEVTGTNGTPGNTIVVTFPDGTTSEGDIDEDGKWKVDIPDGVDLDKEDVITSVEKDKEGKLSTPTKVVVGENCDNLSNGDKSGDGTDNSSLDSNNSVEGNKDSLTDNNATTASNNHASVSNTGKTDSNNEVSELNEDNSTSNNTDKQNDNEAKALPETGETDGKQATIFGALFAGLGSLLLFRRRNKKEEK